MIAAVVIGNLGHTPKLRHTPNGKAILNLHVASNDRQLVDGEWTNVTMWLDVSMFGPRAEGLMKVLSKGMKIAARGALRERRYTGRDGQERVALELVADAVDPLEAPRRGEQEPGTSRPMREGRPPEHRDGFRAPPFPGDDSDIPF